MEKIEVTGCKDCPFRDQIDNEIKGEWDEDEEDYEIVMVTTYYCKHPKRYLVDICDDDDGVITPSDCPLYKSSITISINNNAER